MKRASSWYIRVCVNYSLCQLVQFALGAAALAATVTACAREYSIPQSVTQKQDSLEISFGAPYPIRSLDVFIYRDSLNRPLESHHRLAGAPSIKIPSHKGGRIVLAVANSPAPFRTEALGVFDSAELLTMRYRDENPLFPLMSACLRCEGDRTSLDLKPLLCPVRILSINNFSGSLLEEPVLTLSRINGSAEMLRADGFLPSFTINSPAEVAHPEMMRARLGTDIGAGTVYPQITLYTYPQDAESAFGGDGAILTLSAFANGQMRTFRFPLPLAGRGETVLMNLNIRP